MRTEVALFLLLTFSVSVLARSFYKNDEQRLYSHLMRRYVKYGRPVYDSKDRLTVSTTSFLKNFANFNPETKEMTIVFLSINQWTDVQLKWDPKEFGGLESIHIPQDKVWNPEIHPLNINKPTQELYNSQVTVNHEGLVQSVPYLRQTLLCNAGDDNDHYVCEQRLGSVVYSTKELAIDYTRKGGLHEHFVPNPDWAIEKADLVNEAVHIGDVEYPAARALLYIVRRSHQDEHHASEENHSSEEHHSSEEQPEAEHHSNEDHHEEPEAEHHSHEEHHEEPEAEHHSHEDHHEEPEAEHHSHEDHHKEAEIEDHSHKDHHEKHEEDHHSKEEDKETEGSGDVASVEDKRTAENEVLSWLF